MSLLRFEHVSKQYAGGHEALKDVSFEAEAGEMLFVTGHSGAGKSSLLRLIHLSDRPSRGAVLLGGRNLSSIRRRGLPQHRRRVGVVFQDHRLLLDRSLFDNVALPLIIAGTPRGEIEKRVRVILERVGLGGRERALPSMLSGGQQQRVAIARTLAIEPQVLLLDEPLSNLDAKLRVQTRQELVKLQRRLGITTIFVTHDQIEALTTCHRVAVMDDGVIQQVGTPMELFDHPVNRFVAQFVGSVNLFAGDFRREGDRLRFVSPKLGTVALPAGVEPPAGAFDLAFRPHAVSVAEAPAGERDLALAGAVESAEFLGEFLRYEIRVGEALVIADVPHARGRAPIADGTAVALAVPASELRFVSA
ncbi:MAG: ABC transporter ATP-binding protein [Burkholderiales bacterium]|nr:ABC transporter ATP-binding protein [Burkholderiales bacterium]